LLLLLLLNALSTQDSCCGYGRPFIIQRLADMGHKKEASLVIVANDCIKISELSHHQEII
jgi:hypothetical protein